MSCDVGHRCGSNPALLWLWCKPAATALIGPLAGEPSYAAGVALKRREKRKKIVSFESWMDKKEGQFHEYLNNPQGFKSFKGETVRSLNHTHGFLFA